MREEAAVKTDVNILRNQELTYRRYLGDSRFENIE
jgi:hypothetical protein